EVEALSSPPSASISLKCSPLAALPLPSNMRCSKRWANPVRPGTSWRDPTPYHRLIAATCPVAAGAVTNRRPLSSRYCLMCPAAPLLVTNPATPCSADVMLIIEPIALEQRTDIAVPLLRDTLWVSPLLSRVNEPIQSAPSRNGAG